MLHIHNASMGLLYTVSTKKVRGPKHFAIRSGNLHRFKQN